MPRICKCYGISLVNCEYSHLVHPYFFSLHLVLVLSHLRITLLP
jgi:hypothetical protein